MKKILITGGAGNIGSSLANHFALNNYKVYVFDNLITGSVDKLITHNNIEFIKGDVNIYNEIDSLMKKIRFNYVFHYAALVGVQRTVDNPLLVMKDIDGIRNILEISKNTKVEKIFYSSSSEVYGEPFEMPQNEHTTPLNARLPYAIVKNLGEAYFKAYNKEYQLPFSIFRFFNTYGPNQSNDFVISKFIDMALNNVDITIYGDGSQTRTFCYIDDNLEVTTQIFEKNLLENEVVNIGCDIEIKVLDLAELIIKLLNSKSKIVYLNSLKEGDMSRRQPDLKIMKSILNRQLTSLSEGILKVAKFKSKNNNI